VGLALDFRRWRKDSKPAGWGESVRKTYGFGFKALAGGHASPVGALVGGQPQGQGSTRGISGKKGDGGVAKNNYIPNRPHN